MGVTEVPRVSAKCSFPGFCQLVSKHQPYLNIRFAGFKNGLAVRNKGWVDARPQLAACTSTPMGSKSPSPVSHVRLSRRCHGQPAWCQAPFIFVPRAIFRWEAGVYNSSWRTCCVLAGVAVGQEAWQMLGLELTHGLTLSLWSVGSRGKKGNLAGTILHT